MKKPTDPSAVGGRDGSQRRPAYQSGVVVVLIVLPSILLVLSYMAWHAMTFNTRMEEVVAKLQTSHQSDYSSRLEVTLSTPLTLSYGEMQVMVPPSLLTTWKESYVRPWTGKRELRLNQDEIETYLTELAPRVNTVPQNARFGFVDGQITEIIPSQQGIELDRQKTLRTVLKALSTGINSVELEVVRTDSELSLAKLRSMGITTRLSEGISNFAGSPNFRMHNIRTGAKRYDGLIIPAGEIFSFNDRLGEVDGTTGYLPELVIKGDKLIPEYGGGICQVSTTMFRAAMEAGLPIVERHAHSLPVRYYNPQGYDSTIYPGVVDLRFTNDTGAPILVQTRVEGTAIAFEFYGHPDGRATIIEGPFTYDVQHDGSLKAVVRQIVTTKDGEIEKNSFYSSYKSPALFEVVRNPLE